MPLRLPTCLLAGLACLMALAPSGAEAAKAKAKPKPPAAATRQAPSTAKVRLVAVDNPPPPKDAGPTRATFGAWAVRCARPAKDKPEDCALTQTVAGTQKGEENIGLTLVIPKAHGANVSFMRVIVPGGVFLPPGLGLRVDGTDIGRTGYQYCLPAGCIAEVALDARLQKTLRAGKTATFIIFRNAAEALGIPVALTGIGPGIDALP